MVGAKTYWLWETGPWDLPGPGKAKPQLVAENAQTEAKPRPPTTTEVIVSKNLFDPERGAGLTREVEENSRAFQRIRGMVLLGTAIIGGSRFAILQDGASSPAKPGVPGQPTTPMRIKQGDVVEGFNLSEVADKKVVFTRGAAKVEVVLDYFRKRDIAPPAVAAPGKTGAPPPIAPRVVPNLPRRERPPAPPATGQNP